MKLYTARSMKCNKDVAIKYGIGLLIVDHWSNPDGYPYFAIDNGCYSAFSRGVKWDPSPFLHNLHKCSELGLKPDFAVLPDIIQGGEESVSKSLQWRNVLTSEYPDIPFYLAVQDGMTPDTIPEINISGIFVGGSKAWKLATLPTWVEYAKRKRIGIHVGRMGTLSDIMYAHYSGVGSIDSTTWVQTKGTLEKRLQEYFESIA